MALTERYIGVYVSAESAANYVDAKGIMKAADEIKTELEEFNNFSSDVRTAGSELNPATLYVDGLDYSQKVEELAAIIVEKYKTMIDNLDSIKQAAEKAYNEKQNQLNEDAIARDQAEISRVAAMKTSGN